ncbi:MAG: hypothetical protein KBC91_02960 [Candidatus Omnitrophica bacterium]|nr:hypothetical protein [Candidatus Omnitrophota bacterium]
MKKQNEQKRNQAGGQEMLRQAARLGMIRHPRMYRGCRTRSNFKTQGV